jgi:RND superfamily putative drug exporter
VADRPGLRRWGERVARLRWVVLGGWLVILVACALAYPQLADNLRGPDYSVNRSESSRVAEAIDAHFRQHGAEQDVIVVHSTQRTVEDAEFRAVVDRAVEQAHRSAGVTSVVSPFDADAPGQIADDRHSAIALVGLGGAPRDRFDNAAKLRESLHGAGDVSVSMTGFSPIADDIGTVENRDAERAESVGVPIALIIMILALGAFVPALVPLTVAGAGLLTSYGAFVAMSNVLPFDSIVVTISTMIGTGIGIDYALFIVSRHREELARRQVRGRARRAEITESVGIAVGTAGRTITISGLIVIVSLCSLLIIDSPTFRELAIGVATTVICVLAVALSLQPALLAALGTGVNRGPLPRRLRPAETMGDGADSWWARWARMIMRRPVRFGVAAAALLILCAVPLQDIRYGIDLGTASLRGTSSGTATDVLTANYPKGLMTPIQIVIQARGDRPMTPAENAAAAAYVAERSHDPRLATMLTQQGDGRDLVVAIPSVPVDSPATAQVVRELRAARPPVTDGTTPEILIGGTPGQFVDLIDETSGKAPLVIAVVLALSALFLCAVLASIVLPIKAIVMNLLVTGASIGITVAVFQWGVAASVLDFHSIGYLQVYLPVTVFAVLFGLSMDYEVFLLGRMKEARDSGLDNAEAVADGLAHTARPITAAAAIMIAIFASFLSADVLELKEFGLALALAILFDAVLVRLILVPALMRLFGAANWWPGSWRRHRSAGSSTSGSPANPPET